ncbi:flagellar hook assembly protein FlgD [Mangrovicoccus sp. HB161399]|uniref:flagellar hook assembly protein FlgD n=1 Tax=Mangrovicoccus sp. HB161399 TaxID=2720392 RepID=UPI0015580633|nr:flagellar hook capping FlgD N-terminal domain-containing protein [Mangrovicoccus sp. HB161399]
MNINENYNSNLVASTTSLDNAGKASGNISSDFQTFLKMLTSQMRNQDPQNPLDSSQFAMQLATFSGVEQQVLTNQLLSELSQAFQSDQSLDRYGHMLGLYGSEGRYFGTEDNATFFPDLPKTSTHSEIVIRNEGGEVVRNITVTNGIEKVSWDGKANDGQAAAPGRYTSELNVISETEGLPIISDLLAHFKIVGLSKIDGAPYLEFDSGKRLSPESLSSLHR